MPHVPRPYPSSRFARLGIGLGYYLPRLRRSTLANNRASRLPVTFSRKGREEHAGAALARLLTQHPSELQNRIAGSVIMGQGRNLGAFWIGLWLGGFPGPLGALSFRQVAVLHPVINVAVAHGAQRFVVQADIADGFAQLFREFVQRF